MFSDVENKTLRWLQIMLLGAFCYFGLRQGAIFELIQSNGDNEVVLDSTVVQRFSLESDHAQRIAGKLKAAMARDHLYRVRC